MTVDETPLPGVLLISPAVYTDNRGLFLESWNERVFDAAGIGAKFVQDNISVSNYLTLRGLHYQLNNPQGKLVQAVNGRILDIAVDMRRSSETFGQWAGCELSDENRKSLWIPAGFAHGFIALSDTATVHYKCTDFYTPDDEYTIRWDDPNLGVEWPVPNGQQPTVSDRDQAGIAFEAAPTFP